MSSRMNELSDVPVGFDVTTLRRRYDGFDKAENRNRAEREKIIISEQARCNLSFTSSKTVRIISLSIRNVR